MDQLFGWLDLSTTSRPCYSLICEQASGDKGTKLIKYDGVWMTEKRADLTDRIKRQTGERVYAKYESKVEIELPDDDNSEDYGTSEIKGPPFEIMELPYEIRHDILAYLYDRKTMPVYLRGVNGWARTAIPLPSITQAGDTRLRREAILVGIKETMLEIHSGPGNAMLQKWLASLDFSSCATSLRTGFDAVHALSFPYFSRFPHQILPPANPNNDIQLMLRCKELRTIKLNFVSAELVHHPNGFTREKEIVQLRAEYKLDSLLPLFKWGNLRTVILMGPSQGYHGHEALQALAAWFRLEYVIRANMAGNPDKPDDDSPAKSLSVLVNRNA